MKRLTVYGLIIFSALLFLSGYSVKTMASESFTYASDDEIISKALNYTYYWGDYSIKLNNGVVERSDVHSPWCKVLNVPPPVGDLNIDDRTARGAILSLIINTGGSGNFLFVVANYTVDGKQYVGTDSFGLGDRNQIQNIRIENGDIIIDYLIRKYGEGASVTPSVPVTTVLKIRNNTLMVKRAITYLAEAGNSQGNIADLQKGGLEIIKDQSFPVELENCGKVQFFSIGYRYARSTYFYLTDEQGNILCSFPGLDRRGWEFSKIRAISFVDVNHDELTDVIAISEYNPVTGLKQTDPDPYARIYFQKANGFVDDLEFDNQINEAHKNTDIDTVLEYVKDKAPQL